MKYSDHLHTKHLKSEHSTAFLSSIFLDHLIIHLELHIRAWQCGGLPSFMSGSAPVITYTLCCRPWQGISYFRDNCLKQDLNLGPKPVST